MVAIGDTRDGMGSRFRDLPTLPSPTSLQPPIEQQAISMSSRKTNFNLVNVYIPSHFHVQEDHLALMENGHLALMENGHHHGGLKCPSSPRTSSRHAFLSRKTL